MATAVVVTNVVQLTVELPRGNLALTMSLQRHHYEYCGAGGAAPKNSLFHHNVLIVDILANAVEIGEQMEKLLKKNAPKKLYGVTFQSSNGRTYLVDNSGLNPNQDPNHFFPIGGASLWAEMSKNDYVAASAIRRVEEAINAKAVPTRSDFLDYQKLKAINKAVKTHPIIAAYVGARTALGDIPTSQDAKLGLLSGRSDIVNMARKFLQDPN